MFPMVPKTIHGLTQKMSTEIRKEARRQVFSPVFRGHFQWRRGRRCFSFLFHHTVSQIYCYSFRASSLQRGALLASPLSVFVGGAPLICTLRHDNVPSFPIRARLCNPLSLFPNPDISVSANCLLVCVHPQSFISSMVDMGFAAYLNGDGQSFDVRQNYHIYFFSPCAQCARLRSFHQRRHSQNNFIKFLAVLVRA
jgi:hypothetical protein